eukprot:381087-Pelagomonas_calceolata.AAC.4
MSTTRPPSSRPSYFWRLCRSALEQGGPQAHQIAGQGRLGVGLDMHKERGAWGGHAQQGAVQKGTRSLQEEGKVEPDLFLKSTRFDEPEGHALRNTEADGKRACVLVLVSITSCTRGDEAESAAMTSAASENSSA